MSDFTQCNFYCQLYASTVFLFSRILISKIAIDGHGSNIHIRLTLLQNGQSKRKIISKNTLKEFEFVRKL